MICRLAYNLFEKQLTKQNDLYCDSDKDREEFIKYAQKIKEYETELSQIRKQFQLSLISIQQTNLGFSKVRAFCW